MKKIITNFLNDIKKRNRKYQKRKKYKKTNTKFVNTNKRNIAYYYNTNPIIK